VASKSLGIWGGKIKGEGLAGYNISCYMKIAVYVSGNTVYRS